MGIADTRWLVLAALLVAPVLGAACSQRAGTLFPATDEETQASPIPDAPGVTLVVRVTGGGDSLRIHSEASNRGQETYLVPNACSEEPDAVPKDMAPFRIAARPSTGPERQFPIYPTRGCSEASTTSFLPGQTMEFEVDWDGTSWTESDRQTVVGPGPHAIEVALQLYVGSDPAATPLVARVPIEVLDV